MHTWYILYSLCPDHYYEWQNRLNNMKFCQAMKRMVDRPVGLILGVVNCPNDMERSAVSGGKDKEKLFSIPKNSFRKKIYPEHLI